MLSYDGEPPTRDYLRPLWRLTMLPFGDDEPTHDYLEPTVSRRIRRAEDDKLRDRRAKQVEGVPFFGAAATEIYFVQSP